MMKLRNRLLLLALFLLNIFVLFGQQKGNLYAVLVGVSEYEQPGNNLNYSHRDAIEMYNLFKTKTDETHLQLLTNQRATKKNILRALEEFFTKTTPEDIVIFHFSGHGNNGYFCAYDAPVYFSELKEIFKKTKAKRKVIFADACYSGTFRVPEEPSGSVSNGSIGDNVLLFLSSRSGQYSYETQRLQNGYFTYFLLAGLRGGADSNKNKFITAKELFNFVNPKVKERSGGSQVPVMWGKFNNNMIIFDLQK